MARGLGALFISLALLPACRCAPGINQLSRAELLVTPQRLVMPATFVGARATLTVSVTNAGQTPAEFTSGIEAPFLVDGQPLTVRTGEDVVVRVTFAPARPGTFTGTLLLGPLMVEVEGQGLEVPACPAAPSCSATGFDLNRGQCLTTTSANGAPCETRCLTGICSSGVCTGTIKGCDTGDACLIPICSEATGCGSVPRVCPAPASPCQVATCDAITGCSLTDVLDGTLCGPDDCLATQVDLCLVGQCVSRPRPTTARCSNRWVPATVPARTGTAFAWDGRGLLVFGGVAGGTDLDDTWSFDGTRWDLRLPVSAPPEMRQHRMVWDEARRRVVLVGGPVSTPLPAQTWEWDGMTWLRRFPAISPPSAHFAFGATAEMAYDRARRRVVLHHGADGTWEWDGLTWRHPMTTIVPTATRDFSLAFNGLTRRVTLFGGRASSSGGALDETWEWDGVTWLRASPSSRPPGRVSAPMVWDPVGQRVRLFGGSDGTGRRADTWEWDGVTWVQRQTASTPDVAQALLAFDDSRQRVVLFGGSMQTVWEWTGSTWLNTQPPAAPPPLRQTALAADTTRRRIVLFGGRSTSDVDVTWEWDGTTWLERTPSTSPPARSGHAMAFDALRGRVVLFGGDSATGPLDDTWEWDGTTWTRRPPAVSPSPRSGHQMTWDPNRQRVVLLGSRSGGDLWDWDGTTWQERASSGPPAIFAWDPVGQRLLGLSPSVSGGATWAWTTAWTDLSAPGPVSARVMMSLDPVRQRLVLLARSQTLAPMSTWEWAGTQWTPRNALGVVPNLFDFSLAWDPARSRTLAWSLGDTWVFLP
jgi:hypothetical protein